MFNATIDLLDLEFTMTQKKRIAKMIVRAQKHRELSFDTVTEEYATTHFNAAKKIAPPNTSKEYITFVATLNDNAWNESRAWAEELLR